MTWYSEDPEDYGYYEDYLEAIAANKAIFAAAEEANRTDNPDNLSDGNLWYRDYYQSLGQGISEESARFAADRAESSRFAHLRPRS